ncbi:hypothetical protein OH738_01415 [Streptomyces hirsutus]|uniref:Uncharacterized protein n=1 Tax=Streptomyces hirsutus TaxID=35620 RepID=A0ABZ1H172_9ACTN|nr:hypothetical protein [Streptomyces hirsutus]WSD11014.1 hypothetical protein OIE73_38575 [Streptomyces hirsutus]WTD15640.1 hypothetical protein OH738_01415 [Streptomyces hirsutus]
MPRTEVRSREPDLANEIGAAMGSRGWGQPREPHSHLCDDCQSRAVAAEQQVQADERERREQERLRQEQEAEQADQKAGGRLSRFRT